MSTPRDKLINDLQDQTITYNETTYTMNLNNSDNSLICSGTFVDESPSPENPSPITSTIPAGNYKIKDSKSGGYWYFTLSEDLYGLSDTVKDSITLSSYYGRGYIDRKCKKVKLNNNIGVWQSSNSIGRKYPCFLHILLTSRKENTNIKCTHIKNGAQTDIAYGNTIGIWAHINQAISSYVYMTIPYEIIGTTRNSAQTESVAAFRSWLQNQDTAGTPVEILYQLATPVRTPIVLSKTVISGAIDLPNSSAVTVDPNPYLPIPVMSLGEKDNKVKICVHGQNLFDPKNRIITTHSMMPGFKPSTTITSYDAFMPDLATPRYYIGYAPSGYFQSTLINKYIINENDNKIIFNSNESGYGIGFNIKVKPNTAYALVMNKLQTSFRVSYYNSSGMMISRSELGWNILNIITPDDCYYIIYSIVVFTVDLNKLMISEDIMVLEGTHTQSNVPPFIPYRGYTTEITLPKPLYKLSDSIYDYIDFKTGEVLNRINAVKITSSYISSLYTREDYNVYNAYAVFNSNINMHKINPVGSQYTDSPLCNNGLISNYFSFGGYVAKDKLTSIGFNVSSAGVYFRFDSPETNYGISDITSIKSFIDNCESIGIPLYAYFLMDSYTRTKIDLPELKYIEDENMTIEIYDSNATSSTIPTFSYYTKTSVAKIVSDRTGTFNASFNATGVSCYWIHNGTKIDSTSISITDNVSIGDTFKLVIIGSIPENAQLVVNGENKNISKYLQ